jgi:hypothetical protein
MIINSLKFFFLFCFFYWSPLRTCSQSIHYYAWDTLLNHYPTDIITTQDKGFLLIGDVNSSSPISNNYITRNYLVHTDSIGDTLWTRYYKHNVVGGQNIVQTPLGDFYKLGQTSGGFFCGTGSMYPFSDYCIQSYSSLGDSIDFHQYSDSCFDNILDFTSHPAGGLSALVKQENLAGNISYCLKEMSISGSHTTLALPPGNKSQIERAYNGYWIAGYNSLSKVDYSGNILWQNTVSLFPDIRDFSHDAYDSLVFLTGYTIGPHPDTSNVTKTDSAGNIAWTKTFHLMALDIMVHSTGNYVLTGRSGTDLEVLVLNSDGDSIWSKRHTLNRAALGIKTIEASGGRIATLVYSGGHAMASQFALVLDSIGSSTGINNHDLISTLRAFPNPAGDEITFSPLFPYSNNEYKVEIYNVAGAFVNSFTFRGHTKFDTGKLIPGIYYYLLFCGEKMLNHEKLIILR